MKPSHKILSSLFAGMSIIAPPTSNRKWFSKYFKLLAVLTVMLIVGAQVALADPAPITFAGGDGSAEHPYEISNATQLQNFGRIYQDFPEDWRNTYKSKYYKLTANITLTGTNNYVPAGDPSNNSQFEGTFDGQGFYISGIHVNEARRYVGFVALNWGTIKNLTIKNSTFCSTYNDNPFYVGAIAAQGSNYNSILACVVDNCTIRGTNSQANSHVGGIVGIIGSHPTIQNCVVNNCTISSGANDAASSIGGIIGQSTNASDNNVIIQNCCVKGTTSINGEGSAEIGAIIGIRGDWANVNNLSENYYEWTVQKNSTSVPYNGTGWGIGYVSGETKDTEYAQIESVNSWAALKRAMSVGVTGDGVITLADNVTDPDKTSSSYLAVPQNKTVVLNLNGKTINRNLTTAIEYGCVIYNRGILTINGSGTITGGKNTGVGGGIYNYTATLTINGVSIVNNSAATYGGGIGCPTTTSTITINGGSITGNSAQNGGGITIIGSTVLNLGGGCIISDNSATEKGGGIYHDGILNIGGKVTVSDNSKGVNSNNIYLNSSHNLTINNSLDSDTRIGISVDSRRTFTSGLNNYGSATNFTSDDASYAVRLNNSGEACLKSVYTPSVSMEGWTYGDAAKTPSVSGYTNISYYTTFTYKADGASVFTTTKPTSAGTHTVKATIAESTNYIEGEATTTYTVSKASLTVSGTPTATAVYGTQVKDIPVSATALLGQTEVAGTWAFPSGNTTVPGVGSTTAYTATFTPTTGAGNYNALTTTITPTITQKAVTINGITASNKTYDGSTTATLNVSGATISNLISGDNVTLSSATGQFDDANVGTNKTVAISGLTLGGTSAGNYTIASSSQATTTANITPKPLTITGITASNKTYDGNTTATLAYTNAAFAGKVGSDDLSDREHTSELQSRE